MIEHVINVEALVRLLPVLLLVFCELNAQIVFKLFDFLFVDFLAGFIIVKGADVSVRIDKHLWAFILDNKIVNQFLLILSRLLFEPLFQLVVIHVLDHYEVVQIAH